MQTVLDKPGADADDPVRVHAADEERELALLAQFMRCDSVASLANAIAERSGDGVPGAARPAPFRLTPAQHISARVQGLAATESGRASAHRP